MYPSPTPRPRLIGVYSVGTRLIVTLSSDASTMKTITLYSRCAAPPRKASMEGTQPRNKNLDDPTPQIARLDAFPHRPVLVHERRDFVTFEEFISARLGALIRYATVVTWDPHLAEDITQDVLVRARAR